METLLATSGHLCREEKTHCIEDQAGLNMWQEAVRQPGADVEIMTPQVSSEPELFGSVWTKPPHHTPRAPSSEDPLVNHRTVQIYRIAKPGPRYCLYFVIKYVSTKAESRLFPFHCSTKCLMTVAQHF